MRIHFNDTKFVRHLGKQLTREVRSWGDEISLKEANRIISRAFGYESYDELHKLVGFVDPSEPDKFLSPEEKVRRFTQYVDVLADNDFSPEEAIGLVTKLRSGYWWGFGRETVAALVEPEIAASPIKMQFRNPQVVTRFYRTFKRALRHADVTVPFGIRKLMAKVFGHDSYVQFMACAGHGVPTPSDFYVSPEELDERIEAYLRVLKEAGLSDDQANSVLHSAGAEGWWQLKQLQRRGDPRQEDFADRIEGTGTPTWRPNGTENSVIHRLPARPVQYAYVMLEFDDPYDEAHLCAVLRNGQQFLGYCDDVLGAFLDKVDYELRAEVASIYREILTMPDTMAEFLILRELGKQRVSGLNFLSNKYRGSFENYAGFLQQGGKQQFQTVLHA
ncbi:hypothetical protein [Rhizobium leguminosarum]|uniref:hypothetical protein n=1 Tax=Rhizobium leguminosarum TaxID=384 RepID=UPI001AE96A26|nr:hypothetical protein [Rhizobium leguminosarum]MBP2444789.1 hypothetical protein [Rhizobium leguminosarum]